MDGIKNAQHLGESWWNFFDYCFNHNPTALICEPFWAKLIGAFIAAGVITVLFGVWKYIDYRRKYAAAVRAEWERGQVDEVAIREASWDGDKAYQSHLPDDEVLERIRAAVEQRRRDASAPVAGA
ncbi:MAG: hypothetical protein GEV05_10550 [Betaproteobacteria bacterium]|nr:hypothetical protein [Betaproteobacteria bacterium]